MWYRIRRRRWPLMLQSVCLASIQLYLESLLSAVRFNHYVNLFDFCFCVNCVLQCLAAAQYFPRSEWSLQSWWLLRLDCPLIHAPLPRSSPYQRLPLRPLTHSRSCQDDVERPLSLSQLVTEPRLGQFELSLLYLFYQIFHRFRSVWSQVHDR